MKQIDRYIGTTVAGSLMLAVLGLLGMMTILTFLEQVEDVGKDFTMFAVFRFVLYSMPRMFHETIPYAALIGCLTGVGILASRSEIVVMRASGISTWSITWSALKPALVLIAIGLVVGEYVLSDMERLARLDRIKARHDLSAITPETGIWYRENYVFMHFDIVSQNGVIDGITHNDFNEAGELQRTLFARRGVHHDLGDDRTSYWLLEDVTVTDFSGDRVTSSHLTSLRWDSSITPKLLSAEILVQPDKMSIGELSDKIAYLKEQGLNSGKYELGFWGKVFQPLATIGLVLVGISVVLGPLRSTTMGMRVVTGLIIGILFRFVETLLSPASLVFGFSPIIATLLPIALCFSVGIYLFRRVG